MLRPCVWPAGEPAAAVSLDLRMCLRWVRRDGGTNPRREYRSATRSPTPCLRRSALSPLGPGRFASTADGDVCELAHVVDITGLLDLSRCSASCPGMRSSSVGSCRMPARRWMIVKVRDDFATRPSPPTPEQTRDPGTRHRAPIRVGDRIALARNRPGTFAVPARKNQRRLDGTRADRRRPASDGVDRLPTVLLTANEPVALPTALRGAWRSCPAR